MATGGAGSGDDLLTINVRYNTGEPHPIRINKEWTIKRLKEEIVATLGIRSGNVDLIFSGKGMADDLRIKDIDLGEMSYLNAVKHTGVVTNYPTISMNGPEEGFHETVNKRLLGMSISAGCTPDPQSEKDSKQCFYVYCRYTCKEVKPAKLRVRCATCGHGTLNMSGEPAGWDDVTIPGRIEGECRAPNCDGSKAEFYFKCAAHQTGEGESLPPLPMIVTNTKGIPCLSCFAYDSDSLFVFPCAAKHTMCLDCFKNYCSTHIKDRTFVQTKECGYTLACPVGNDACKKAYITNSHTFKIAGKELYARYQEYGTKQFVLDAGGVLCPGVDCGEGLLPDDPSQRRLQCPKCKFTFCRSCKSAYHNGQCATHRREVAEAILADRFPVDPERAAVARLELETYRAIDEISKPCPGCKNNIEKIDGCNHVTCKCKFDFCWLCLIPWGENCRRKHWFGGQ